MAVALDAASSNDTRTTAATTLTHNLLTIGAGSNTVAIFTLFLGNWTASAPTGISVVWDQAGANQSLTQVAAITSGTGKGIIQVYGLIAPASGNKTLTVNWTNTADAQVAGVSFTGADQTNPFTNATTNSGTSSQSSVSVPTTVLDAVVAGHMIISTTQSIASVNFTNEYIDNSNANFGTAMNHEENNASATMTATMTGSDTWIAAGINIISLGEAPQPQVQFGIIGAFTSEW